MTPNTIPKVETLAQVVGGAGWRLALHHSRPDALILWIARGSGRAILRGREIRFSSHSLIYVPANTLFSIDAGPQPIGSVVTIPTSANIALPEAETLLRIRDVHQQADIARLIETLQNEGHTGAPYHKEAAIARASLISIWFRRAMLDAPAQIAPRADTRLAAAFCDLVVRHYRSGRAMAHYAEMLGVTPAHLARSCKSSAGGLSAAAILTERSLHAARNLLRDTDHPFRQIAEHLGFGSAAYFTRFVHHHTGQSPTHLRSAA